MVRVLVESRLLNGSALEFTIYECAALPATLPGKSFGANKEVVINFDIEGLRLAPIAPVVLLWHLAPLCLALLNDVHPNLHPQVLLVVTKLVVNWLDGGYSRRRDVLVQLLVGAECLLDQAADRVLLGLLHTVYALGVVGGLQGDLRRSDGNGRTRIIDITTRDIVVADAVVAWIHSRGLLVVDLRRPNIIGRTRQCLDSLGRCDELPLGVDEVWIAA